MQVPVPIYSKQQESLLPFWRGLFGFHLLWLPSIRCVQYATYYVLGHVSKVGEDHLLYMYVLGLYYEYRRFYISICFDFLRYKARYTYYGGLASKLDFS